MKYTCTFRNHTGALAKRVVDAPSRAQALEEFRQLGITPISIAAGGSEDQARRIQIRRPSSSAVIVVCLLALLGGGVAWYCLSRKSDVPGAGPGRQVESKEIQKETPPPAARDERKEVPEIKPPLSSVEAFPAVLPTNELPKVRKFGEGRPVYTNMSAVLNKDRFDVFKHRAEFEMAALIMIKPGQPVIGDANYNKGFEKDLLACLDDPIDIDASDPEDINELKRSVKEMKEQVRKMVANGDDVRDVFTQARRELQELGIYKMNVEQNLREILKSKDILTEQDMEDSIKAANAMLEAKGIAPIQVGGLARHLIKRRIERQRDKRAASQKR